MIKSLLIGFLLMFSWSVMAKNKIIGGEEVKDVNHPGYFNTVTLIHTETGKTFCTGSIIHKKIIATAKHCITEKKVGSFKIYFGDNSNKPLPGLTREVESFSVFGPKNFATHFPSLDVAYVKLKNEVPNADGKNPNMRHFRPVEVLRDPSRLNTNKEIDVVGYGNSSPVDGKVQAGQKFFTSTLHREYINNARFIEILVFDGPDGSGTCHGDSGGPAYVYLDNKWYLIGVTNGFDLILTPEGMYETPDPDFPFNVRCDVNQSIYSFLGRFIPWIEKDTGIKIENNTDNTDPTGMTPISTTTPKTFEEWCQHNDYTKSSWITVKTLMEIATIKRSSGETARDVFFNCKRAAEILNNQSEITIPEEFYVGSLSPLMTLRNLKSFTVKDQEDISLKTLNISSLKNHPSLSKLRIGNSKIKSLNELRALKDNVALKSIILSRNEIEDITPLKGFSHLEQLDITNNKVVDISKLTGLTSLKLLDFSQNAIANSKFSLFPSLEVLRAVSSTLLKVDLSQNKNLLEVNLGANDKLSILELPPGIEMLFLGKTLISDYSYLTLQTEMRLLSLSNGNMENLEFLKNMSQLTRLDLPRNKITDISLINGENFPKLKRISIAGNEIESFAPLKNISTLKTLWANGNPITNGEIIKDESNCPTHGTSAVLARICN